MAGQSRFRGLCWQARNSDAYFSLIKDRMSTSSTVELLAKDLNPQGGVYCPSPKAEMAVWNSHPKIYLDVARTGQAKCPYCGTLFKLKDGEHVGSGH